MNIILVIEDNTDVRENIKEILELSNYKVLTAADGKEGIKIAKEEIPDLIICDVMMPELDGFGVLHLLSKNPFTASIPFVFLTAKAEKEDFRKGMNLGADDYLTKPFDDIHLLDIVELRLKKLQTIKDATNSSVKGDAQKGLKELVEMVSNSKNTQLFPKKQIIYAQGSYPNYLYYIQKGRIKTIKNDLQGNELITNLYKDGDYIGYNDLLAHQTYTESAVALEDTIVCHIHKDDFLMLTTKYPEVAEKFIAYLTKDIVNQEDKLISLAYQSVRKRVAIALMTLKSKYETTTEIPFTIAIAREDLSNMVGASKETVIRTLSDFKIEGLIEIAGSKITIAKPEKLNHLRN